MSNFKFFYQQNPSTYSNYQITFNQNFKSIIYNLLINQNKLQYPISTKNNILFFNPIDKEFITKTLDKNYINYKLNK
jgi:hypothetical protein